MQFINSYPFARALAFAGMALAVAPGCGDDGGDGNNDRIDAGQQTDAGGGGDAGGNDGVTIDRSILIRDTETLAAGNFGLRRTVQAIIDSSEGEMTTPEDFVQSLLSTFNDASRVNPDSTLTIPVDVRPGEASLSPEALLDPANDIGLRVVGIFNRFERRPMDGAFCGSARLVYVMPTDNANGGSTLTLMFDFAVPNPGTGLEGCRPVAQFWAGLSAIESAEERAQALEAFFFTDGDDLPAVAKFNNIAMNGGVTTDHFVNGVKWQMRSYTTALNGDMRPEFRPVRVNSPLVEYFDSDFNPATAPGWDNTDATLFAAEREAFQQDFLTNMSQLPRLIQPETSDGALNAQTLVLGIGGPAFTARYRDFQHDSEDSDNPAVQADDAFKAEITAAIEGTDLTADDVLNRAGALTCGGCHQFTVGKRIGVDDAGQPVTWPSAAPGGFVHITETGEISGLLQGFWLPDRLAKLNTFLGTSARVNVAGAPTCSSAEVQATKAALLASKPGSERQAAIAAYNHAVDQLRACNADH